MDDEQRFKIWEEFMKNTEYGIEEWEDYLCKKVEEQARADERQKTIDECISLLKKRK